MIRDPETPAEWQAAVNAAKALLALDDARLYGLVTGGPKVDRDRCVHILDAGLALGWVPREHDVAALMNEIRRGGRG